ncbi:hypothetical protein C4D60_Mb03t00820 [Musa balbisiana]|uniref:Secreted protein n=1 Tax=Musa balbisiana TaxID=52838 RepID=A0A4S8J6L7_MUSBA|nr:hypothetical protein C4D60_Mb03t00820 [Musa balbisiana]
MVFFFFLALTLFLFLGVEFPRASPLLSPPPNRASIFVGLILHHRSLHRLPLFLLAVALARSAVELQERQQSFRLASYWHGLPWCRVGDKRSGKTCRLDQRVRLHHVDTGGYRHKHDEIYAKMDHTNLGFQGPVRMV